MTETPVPPKGKRLGIWIAIGVAVVVVGLVAAEVLVIKNTPSPTNANNTINVSVLSVIDDSASEAAVGHDTSGFILNVSVNRAGSSSVVIYPSDFYFVTSDGTFQADQSGFSLDVTNALNTVTLSNGQTTSGQIYDSFSSGTTISSIYYSLSGKQYSASTPPVSVWISDITQVNAIASNSALIVAINAPPFGEGFGEITSGSQMFFNITISNTNFLFGNVAINSITVNSPFIDPDFSNILPVTLTPGSSETLTFYIYAPTSSYYGAIDFSIT